ncbi:nucleoside permease [Calycomorphotria hydatis]|uniref:Nucleoside transporter YegT n=1 Tax=Calycomorphotria hydatis TaxID=2528027 RepID=A0A517T9T7_9PLAN|nr:nucleoside permease [Calycomorphotria hydatis]QDT65119.1 Putative nucleoside transporter YegT [Calycomorphotria hydatis]
MLITRLSIMMFLQYFVWGAWYVTLGTYLSTASGADGQRLFSDAFVGDAYGTDAIAAMIAPLVIGLIVECFFSSERVLAVLHMTGAVLLYLVSTFTSPSLVYLGILAHFMCYMPTISLTTSLSFENLDNPQKTFPYIRVFGTIGWIVAGILISWIKLTTDGFVLSFSTEAGTPIEPTTLPLKIAAVVQFVLGIYCFSLPHTPPKAKGRPASIQNLLGFDAFSVFKKPGVTAFIIAAILICIPLKFYYTWTNAFLNEIGIANAAAKMTLGQMSEIGFMLLLPLAFARLGIRWILAIGMACWAIRYVLFAFGDAGANIWMLYVGILLHGICYDFFFVAGQIHLDQQAPPDRRASVQGLLTFLTLGVGMFLGSLVSGRIVESFTVVTEANPQGVHSWESIWLIPAALAAVVTVGFLIFFRSPPEETTEDVGVEDAAAAQGELPA